MPENAIKVAARLEAAFAGTSPIFEQVGYAWDLIRRSAWTCIQDLADLDDLIEALSRSEDYGLEELHFETLAEVLHVRLFDEREPCDRNQLIEALKHIRKTVQTETGSE